MAERWVALLRGVNVGGANRLAMADLRATMAESGASDVATHVQSGNVVFDHPVDDASAMASLISAAVRDHHGLDVRVVVRTGDELRRVATHHPDDGTIDAKFLHVVFFDRLPDAAPTIDVDRFAPDRFVIDGREAFVTYPNGSGRSKLTIDVFERAFGVSATARNMNSVRKIAALTS